MILDSSGFTVDAGLEPNTMALVLAYMALSFALGLYCEFGLSFIYKGIKSDSVWQKTYYRGLGAFFFSVAISQFIYIVDLLSRDVYDKRLFLTSAMYSQPFHSYTDADYFVWIYSLILFSMALLMFPVEKYLYAQKRKPLTIFVSIGIPIPLILRIIEINHKFFGLQIGLDDTSAYQLAIGVEGVMTPHYYFMQVLWMIVVGIIALSALYLLKLYLDLGKKSPPGSQLRKKSRMIVFGLLIWLAGIFLTSTVMKEISDANSDLSPGYPNQPGTFQYFISSNGLFFILPFVIPSLLLLSLFLLVVGFTRKYD